MTNQELSKKLALSISPFIKSAKYTGTIPEFRRNPRPEEIEQLLKDLYSIIQSLSKETAA